VYKWILPSISEILAATEPNITSCTSENSEETVLKQNCGGVLLPLYAAWIKMRSSVSERNGVVCSDPL